MRIEDIVDVPFMICFGLGSVIVQPFAIGDKLYRMSAATSTLCAGLDARE